MNVNVGIGKGIEIAVDVNRLMAHERVFAHALRKGLTPILQDCHASITFDSIKELHPGKPDEEVRAIVVEESRAKATAKLASMYAGEITIRGDAQPRAKLPPLEAEARRLARLNIHGFIGKWEENGERLRAIAAQLDMPCETPAECKAVIDEAVKRNAEKPETIEEARKSLEKKESLPKVDVSKLV